MSLRTKLAAAACAALVLAGSLATPAAAKPKLGPALGFGLVAGTMLGVAAASGAYGDPYYVGHGPRCRFVDQYNAFGLYLGTTRVCRW